MGATEPEPGTDRPRRSWRLFAVDPPPIDDDTFPDVAHRPPDDGRGLRATLARVRSSIFWVLVRRQRRYVGLFVLGVFSSGFTVINLASAQRNLVDLGIVQQSAPLGALLVNVLIAAVLFAVTNFLFAFSLSRIVFQMDFDLRTWLFTRLQSADVRRLDTISSGQVVSRAITDVSLVEQAMQILPFAVVAIPPIVGLAVFVFLTSPLAGLAAVLALPINLAVVLSFRRPLRALSWAEVNERAEAAAAIDEPVRGIRVVHAFDRAEAERARVATVAAKVFGYAMARVRLLARYEIVIRIVPVLCNAGLLYVAVLLTADGLLTLGTMLLAFQLVSYISDYAQGFDNFASSFQYLAAAQGRLEELLVLGERRERRRGAGLGDAGGVEMVGVTVRLGGRTVLEQFDLAAAPGDLVVLRGAPGSGKSTLASVAAGLLHPDEGQVWVSGASMRLLDTTTARRAVLVATEDPFLFAGTVRDNLVLGVDGPVSDDALLHALRVAGVDDVESVLLGGLDSEIGDRGLTLSGGQRQRIALARALISPPLVLILDDALSAVNPALEVEILERVRVHSPTTVVLCMTRRVGPTTIADRVVDLPDPSAAPAPGATADASAPVTTRVSGLTAAHLRVLEQIQHAPREEPIPNPAVERDEPVGYGAVFRPYLGVIALAMILLVCVTLANLAPSVLIGDAADLVRSPDVKSRIPFIAGGVVLAGVILALSAAGFRITAQRYTQSVMYFLRRTVFRRLSRLGIDYYDRELPGKVAARVIYDLDVLAEFLQRLAFLATLVIAQFVIAVTVMIVLSPRVIVPVAVATVAVVVLSVVMVPRLGRVIAAQRDRLGEVTARFEEDFAARHEIRRYGAGARRVQGFVTVAWALRQAQRKVQVVSLSFGSGLRLIGDVMSAVVLATAGAAVVAMDSTVGVALTLQLLATQATQPLNTIGSLFSAGQRGLVSWNRLREPFAAPVLPVEHPDAAPVGSVDPTVRFERVSFRYPGTERVVLPDLDLVLDADRSVALVGYTGAGKSSVAKLLMRTYDPDAGRVLVGGRDLRTMPIREYRRCVGVVPQDAFLFKGTVHSNISYGEPGAGRAAVEAAAREVGAWEVLSQLPGGFDHDVQEEAHNLTGAQQQLVALARAWMTRPRIMILDEATSALDAPLERAVLTAVTRLDCTTLMVTHRETVAQAADEVIVLDAGRIVDAGPPASLIGAGGPYDRLWAAPDVRAPRGTGDRAAGTTGDG